MRLSLFPFQTKAVDALRHRAASALFAYNNGVDDYNQVLSLQAPTGSGKTIIMSAFIESVLFGTENMASVLNAVFVWLSDSPNLNEQSRDKLALKSDRIPFDHCVTIEETSFDQETLSDGKIYFLNTQKLSKSGKLGQHGDGRQYTIWETLDNTAREKPDRLYFIIDEARRGMQGHEAGKATSIMQRFIKGAPAQKMQAMPLIIGMSATPERFHKLVENCPKSTLSIIQVPIEEVRASGLLKDRIVVKYPGDKKQFNETAMLQAATDDWLDKCRHWYQYTQGQHYQRVDPVFVIQVAPARAGQDEVSATDLDALIADIEARTRKKFSEYEVVHTFGAGSDITANGLTIHYEEPAHIADNHKIRVVLFKESLSTGWDCPRAETMMSFRHAQDATYIAQLLGRMIRTPRGSRVSTDETLNSVSLFLPYYDEETVQEIVKELRNTEGSDIPTVIDEENMSQPAPRPWGIRPHRTADNPDQIDLFWPEGGESIITAGETDSTEQAAENRAEYGSQTEQTSSTETPRTSSTGQVATTTGAEGAAGGVKPSPKNSTAEEMGEISPSTVPNIADTSEDAEQIPLIPKLDRKSVLDFINSQGFLTYHVRSLRIHDYIKSLLDFASLLTTKGIYREADDEVCKEITSMIHAYAEEVRASGQYAKYRKNIMEMKLSVQMFDAFGQALQQQGQLERIMTNAVLDRQVALADAKLGQNNYTAKYETRYLNTTGETKDDCDIDCILFASNETCLKKLAEYAKKKFHDYIQAYRRKIANREEDVRRAYKAIAMQGDAVSKQNLELPICPSIGSSPTGEKYYRHLYIDPDGTATIKLNSWEQGTIEEEATRPDFVCWVRNPSKAFWALTVPYKLNNKVKAMYPDFLIIRSDPDFRYVMDILEPHGDQYKDSLAKAKGLVNYVNNEQRVGRVQMIRERKDSATGKKCYLRLEFTNPDVQEAVMHAMTLDEFEHIFDTMGFIEK